MNKIARLSLLASTTLALGLGFAAGADALPGAKPKGATLQDLQAPATADIAAAEQRVDQAKAQVDLANKQVGAAKALLKAAQADLKAATASLQALKLSAHAQGLVQETGMTPAVAPPVSIASKDAPKEVEEAPPPAPAPTPAPEPAADSTTTEDGRIKTAPPATDTSEPILLR